MIVARGLGRHGVAAALLVTAGLGLVGSAETSRREVIRLSSPIARTLLLTSTI